MLWLFHLCVAHAQTSTAFPRDGQVCLFSIFFFRFCPQMHCERVVVCLENVRRRQMQHFSLARSLSLVSQGSCLRFTQGRSAFKGDLYFFLWRTVHEKNVGACR